MGKKSLKLTILLWSLLWMTLVSVATAQESSGFPHRTTTLIVDGGGQAALLAAINEAQPGDTILVKAGNYDDHDPDVPLAITKSGAANAPITLLGEKRPKLGNLEFFQANHFIIEGFEIANQFSNRFFLGLEIRDSHHLTVRNMLIHHLTGSAISTETGSNIIIENSKIYEIVPSRPGNDAHCFINGEAKNIVFRNNECYGFIGDGYQAWRTNESLLYDRGLTLIEGNHIYNTKGSCSENAIDIKAEAGILIIRNNILSGFKIMEQEQCPIHATGCGYCWAINIQDGGLGKLLIENNEISDSDNGIFNHRMPAIIQNNVLNNIAGYGLYNYSLSSRFYHNTFLNNKILMHPNSVQPHEVANNLFYNVGTTVSGNYHHNGWFGQHRRLPGKGDIEGRDPGLNQDYSLKAGSLLIDQGTELGVTTDFMHIPNSRPFGAAPDIGAFEFTGVLPEPTPSASPTATSTRLPTASLTPTATSANSATATPTDIPAATSTPTRRATAMANHTVAPLLPTSTPTATPTNSPTRRATATATNTPRPTATPTSTNSPTRRATATATHTVTPTSTDTPRPTATSTPTPTDTPRPTATNTPTPTDTPRPTATSTPTSTDTPRPTDTNTPTPTDTPLPTATSTPTPTDTPLPTATNTPTPTDTPLPTATSTPTSTDTPRPTDTSTPTPTDTPLPTATSTPTPTDTPLPTATSTSTPTDTPRPTATSTPTSTDTPLPTATSTPTPTDTPLPTATSTPTPTDTPRPTATSTPTPTDTPRPTATSTSTPTDTPLPTATSTPTSTDTPRPTDTNTPTPTDTPRPTATSTPTPTDTPLPTATNTPTPTDTPRPTDTPTPPATPTATEAPLRTITPTSAGTPEPTPVTGTLTPTPGE
jgi:hypothetical protein